VREWAYYIPLKCFCSSFLSRAEIDPASDVDYIFHIFYPATVAAPILDNASETPYIGDPWIT
jgi:hypothetical protein